jgi:hypothetical protein
MSQGKFSIVFLSKYKTKNLVRMLLLLSEFSPSVLGLDVGHALKFCAFLLREMFLVLSHQVPLSYAEISLSLFLFLLIWMV